MFDAYKSCRKGDITFFFCHVTLRDPIFKGTFDFVKGG